MKVFYEMHLKRTSRVWNVLSKEPTFCCKELKELYDRHLISFFEQDRKIGVLVYGYDMPRHWFFSFCPFCGEKVEFEKTGTRIEKEEWV